MENIKPGDWVIVLGEANECWQVESLDRRGLYTMLILKNGDTEPIDKCERVNDTSVITEKGGRHFCSQYPFMDNENEIT